MSSFLDIFPVNLISQKKLFEGNEGKIFWLIQLRWLALGLFIISSIPNYYFGFLDRTTLPIYIGLCSILFVLNVILTSVFHKPKQNISNLVLHFHLGIDLFFLTFLLYFSKGWNNPLSSLFLLNSALGGLLIGHRKGWPYLFLTHTLVLFLQLKFWSQMSFNLDIVTLSQFLFFHLMILVFWLVMSSLAIYLENQSQALLKQKVGYEKQDRLRAIGALTAGFSHEFSSPLNAAKIRLERLERQLSEKNENLEEAIEAIKACELVIRKMNSSQMDSRSYNPQRLNIKEFLHDIVEAWKYENQTSLKIELDIEEETQVLMAPLHFAQVMFNLLDNASHSEGITTITVKFAKLLNGYMLEVKDDGAGFEEEILKRIGEPFLTNKEQGTGLGIYLTEIFAQSLGGNLYIHNLKPHGCSVKIEWPTNGVAHEKNPSP